MASRRLGIAFVDLAEAIHRLGDSVLMRRQIPVDLGTDENRLRLGLPTARTRVNMGIPEWTLLARARLKQSQKSARTVAAVRAPKTQSYEKTN